MTFKTSGEPIRLFRGEFRFLSNFYYSPIDYLGFRFPTVEHLFQWRKCIADEATADKILKTEHPRAAKALGRQTVLPSRGWWENHKVGIMRECLELKFPNPNARLGLALLRTINRELIEGNAWQDTFWGVDIATGKGQNWLGQLLMERRAELRKQVQQ